MVDFLINLYFVMALVLFVFNVMAELMKYWVDGILDDDFPITNISTYLLYAIFSITWGIGVIMLIYKKRKEA